MEGSEKGSVVGAQVGGGCCWKVGRMGGVAGRVGAGRG